MKKGEEVKILKTYSEAVKLKAVSDIESGLMTQAEAARHFGCTKGSVWGWMQKYGRKRTETKIVRVNMKSEADKIRELESALAKAHMKLDVYEKMMEFVERDHGIAVKKNTDTKEYELVRGGESSGRTVKYSE